MNRLHHLMHFLMILLATGCTPSRNCGVFQAKVTVLNTEDRSASKHYAVYVFHEDGTMTLEDSEPQTTTGHGIFRTMNGILVRTSWRKFLRGDKLVWGEEKLLFKIDGNTFSGKGVAEEFNPEGGFLTYYTYQVKGTRIPSPDRKKIP